VLSLSKPSAALMSFGVDSTMYAIKKAPVAEE
jgi:hypothetical protein